MLFVCLSHFSSAYFASGSAAESRLLTVSMIAAPTFMLLSGMLLGLLAHDRTGFERQRNKFIDRGLFQVSIGHVIVCAATLQFPVVVTRALARGEVTDVVGLAMILGALLAPRTRPAARLVLGVGFLGAQAALGAAWKPVTALSDAAYAVLLGTHANGLYDNAFPLLPWLAVYLVGSGLGGLLASDLGTDTAGAARRLARWGGAAALAAIAVKATYHVLKTVGVIAPNETLFNLTYVFGRYPPSPAYLFLFGGLGCVGVAATLLAESRGALLAPLRQFAVVGRASWAAFVTQFAVYNLLGTFLRPANPSLVGALLYFVASLVPTVLVARWWAKRDLNRYLTVGYPWRWRSRSFGLDNRELASEMTRQS